MTDKNKYVDCDRSTDDMCTSYNLRQNIHSVITTLPATVIFLGLTSFYSYLLIYMFKNKDEPRVRTRSPVLLMVITLAVYLDCIFKLCILVLDYKFVDLKC